MDAVAPWESTSASAESFEEDRLLCEALAIIGDLDCELDDSPINSSPQADAQPSSQPKVTDGSNLRDGSRLSTDNGSPVNTTTQQIEWPKLLHPTGSTNDSGKRPKKRQREELLYLRGLVAELEGRLAGLRKSEQEQQRAHDGEARDESSNDVARALWENVAVQQREQRQKAEVENMKLKRLLLDQIELGKKLERLLLRKRPNAEALESSAPDAKRLHRSNSRSWNRVQVFDELAASCSELYRCTARVMSRFDLGAQVRVPRKVELVHDPEDGLIVQNRERRVIPFNYEEVASEMWLLFPQASAIIKDVDHCSDESSEIRFRLVPQAGYSTGEFTVKAVKRRYEEDQRTVIVYSAHLEPSAGSDSKMDGISIRHKGWHIVEPLPGNPRGSMVTVYHASVPEIVDSTPAHERKVGTLTNFLLSAISTELEANHQLLEDRLMERSLQSSQKIA